MTFRAGFFTGVMCTLLAVGLGWLAWSALRPALSGPGTKPAPPAIVKPVKEDDFNRFSLTPEAEKRLGIRTALIEKKSVPRFRTFGGEVTIPPGQSLLVAAPLPGVLKAASQGLPRPGQKVTKGQVLFQFLPLLTPEARTTLATARVDADGQVKNAQTAVDAAKIMLDRATVLFQKEAGSRRMVDDAQAVYDLALKTLEAAKARHDFLVKALSDFEKGTAAPLPIESPVDGILRSVSAQSEQTVPSGAALFEVLDFSRAWLRVPVFVGDLFDIAADKPASAGSLTPKPAEQVLVAKPITAPPSANAQAGTVDLFYELDNSAAALSPGQRLAVSIPIKGDDANLTIPWSAIIHDIQGSTWVYETPAEHTFMRRRVQVRFVAWDFALNSSTSGIALGGLATFTFRRIAVLESGPPAKSNIVVDGAAELFGTEVGFSK